MAEKDLIEPSTSPWSSPVIAVPKKKGGIRICIDYRKLNQVTIPDSQPFQDVKTVWMLLEDPNGSRQWIYVVDSTS